MLIPSLESRTTKWPIFIILLDTNTLFSKTAKLITNQPYNHVSISFTRDFEQLYTFSLKPSTSNKSLFGGFMIENKEKFKHANYALYSVYTKEYEYRIIHDTIDNLIKNIKETKYNILNLIDIILNTKWSKNTSIANQICSTFIVELFKLANIELLDSQGKIVKPYDLVNSNLINFLESGIIKN